MYQVPSPLIQYLCVVRQKVCLQNFYICVSPCTNSKVFVQCTNTVYGCSPVTSPAGYSQQYPTVKNLSPLDGYCLVYFAMFLQFFFNCLILCLNLFDHLQCFIVQTQQLSLQQLETTWQTRRHPKQRVQMPSPSNKTHLGCQGNSNTHVSVFKRD